MVDKIKSSLNTVDSYVSMALGLAVVLIIGALVYNMAFKKQAAKDQAGENETEITSQTQTSLPLTHTVKNGETLWSIAETYYKSGYNWVDIAKANKLTNPGMIANGQTLSIPEAKTIEIGQVSSASTTAETQPENKQYTIKRGDNLWKIAVEQYNNGYKWLDIAKANNLTNPGIIHADNTLTLP